MEHTLSLRIVAAVVCTSAGLSHAQMTWFVDDDAPPGGDGLSWATAFEDLQPAMELALAGDAIWVAEGVYVPSVMDPIAGEDQPYFLMPDGVALLGGFRGDETSADQRDPEQFESVISGDLLGNDLDVPVMGAFDSSPEMLALYQSKLDNTGTLLFVDRTGPGTVLDGLVFEDAFTDTGSVASPRSRNGVFVLGSILDVRGCTFRDNLGWLGGAAYIYDCGASSMQDTDFLAQHPCGQVQVAQPSAVLIEDTRFIDNYSNFGSPSSRSFLISTVRTSNSILVIDRCTFEFSRILASRFSDDVRARGLLLGDGTHAIVTGSVFRQCSDPGSSNGVAAIGVGVTGGGREALSIAEIDSCLFENNAVPEFGAVRFYGGAGTVTRSAFHGNRRLDDFGFGGGAKGVAVGAIFDVRSSIPTFLSISDNEFVGNSAGNDTGSGSEVPIVATAIRQGTIARNTFAENTTNGETIFLYNPELNDTAVQNNLIAGETPTLDPLFVRSPDDGGDGFGDDPSTPLVDESLNDDYGDLRLRAGSPAIDAGSTFFDVDTILDLAGNDRYVDDPGIPGAFVDLGAYEFQGVTCLPDVNQDGVASPADFNAWISAYNDRSSLADQNRDGAITPADFNAWILNYNTGCP